MKSVHFGFEVVRFSWWVARADAVEEKARSPTAVEYRCIVMVKMEGCKEAEVCFLLQLDVED